MSYSGDAAEQVVRMSLETGEVAVKLAGAGAKQLAVLLYAILRDQTKTKGKTRLTNMLRSGKELKVFAVKDSDLQLFCREAKKYGVLYCVLKDTVLFGLPAKQLEVAVLHGKYFQLFAAAEHIGQPGLALGFLLFPQDGKQ